PQLSNLQLEKSMGTLTQAKTTRAEQFASQFRLILGRISSKLLVTLLGLAVMSIFLMPLGYMLATAFKQESQLTAQKAPLWPAQVTTYDYQGKDLTLYNVPTSEGTKQWALVKGYREDSDLIDPAHPEQGVCNWKGRYRILEPAY